MIATSLRVLAGSAIACLFAVAAVPAFAYTLGGSSSATAPASANGGSSFSFTATFKDTSNNPITGTGVTFSEQSGPPSSSVNCAASFNPVTATTDGAGTASTTVTLPAGCPGGYVLGATLAGGGTVTASVVEPSGFPNTAGIPAIGIDPLAIAALLVGIALVVMARLTVFRPRPARQA